MRERKNSQNSNGRSSAGKIAQYGLLIALAFIFSYVEALIPLPVPVPGIKLGLAQSGECGRTLHSGSCRNPWWWGCFAL